MRPTFFHCVFFGSLLLASAAHGQARPLALPDLHDPGRCSVAKSERLRSARLNPPPPVTAFDVQHYDLDLTVNFVTQTIQGECAITAVSETPALTHVLIDLHDALTVTSVERDGTALLFTRANHRLDITLDAPVDVSESFTVTIGYGGTPPNEGLASFMFDTHAGQPIAATLSEPWFARTWWPCKETPTDKATADVSLTVPADMIGVSNGLVTSVEDHGATKTFHHHTDYPIATYLISATITNFSTWSSTYMAGDGTNMALDYYVYPEHVSQSFSAWPVVPFQIEYYRTVFGEYPFVNERYGMAEFPFGGAMEHQTMTSMGECCVSSELIIAHELAHQWWGDMVTCADWHHIWLNEGFATWSEALWYGAQQAGGYDDYVEWIDHSQGFPTPLYRYDLSDPWEIFSYVVYDKGAWVVHMLRGVLGEADFWDGLMDYRAAFAYSHATTEDLRDVMEARSGMDLDFFFDQWVYGLRRPNYRYHWFTDAAGDVVLSLGQVQAEDVFTMPIDIDVVTTSGTERFTIWNDQRSQSFVLDVVAGTPQSIVFDPDNWVLDWHQESAVDVAVAGDAPRVTRVTPQPSAGAVTIQLKSSAPYAEASVHVFDTAGRRVATIHRGAVALGTSSFTWDGRGESGQPVAPGVYYVTLDTGTLLTSERVVRIR